MNVSVANLLTGSIGPYTYASGQEDKTHPTYSDTDTLLTAAASGKATTLGVAPSITGVRLSSNTLTSSASGAVGPIRTQASSEIEGLALSLNEVGFIPIITLGGTNNDIKSSSYATTVIGGPSVATGSSSIAGLTLKVLGVNIDLSAYQHAAPNTVIPLTGLAAALTGLTVTVNKQTVIDVDKVVSIETDALDIDFNNLRLGGGIPLNTLVSGDIILAQSFAQVPEPAIWAELLLGLACVGGLTRSRRRSIAV